MPPEPSHPYTVLDVFTDRPLTGNPLAVFTAGEEIPSRLMQSAARELHLSETVFLLPGDAEADASVRIFTPGAELPFAGHPVLGAAFVVAALSGRGVVRLRTGAGVVPVVLTRDHGGDLVYGEMEQPIPTVAAYERTDDLLGALGLTRAEVPLPVAAYTNGPTHVMVAVADRAASSANAARIAALDPDWAALRRLGEVTVSCFTRVGDGRFKSRVFCPGLGVSEDPATGSAAGPLALHASRHGWAASGEEIEILQGVEIQRPSILRARIEGDPDRPTKIAVGGAAVTVAHGHFRLA